MRQNRLVNAWFQVVPMDITGIFIDQLLEQVESFCAAVEHRDGCQRTTCATAGGVVDALIKAQSCVVGTIPEAYLPKASAAATGKHGISENGFGAFFCHALRSGKSSQAGRS